MKKLITLLSFLSLVLISTAQPPVYLVVVSHNEETGQWNNPSFYSNNRNKLITLADHFYNTGVAWNMQSDWVFLTNVITQDSAFYSSTNNKNILRWMYEDRNVEMDPHGHETQYIYPDLVKLLDSIGLPESKVMGGSLHNQSNGINPWTNLINGQYGLMFPNFFWQPDYLMGGGTPNHVNDLKYYGFWNPKDTLNYLQHEPANHLRHIGVGCEMKIKDTSTVQEIVDAVRDVINKVQSGQYPANGFYLQSVFFSQADLNNNFFTNKVLTIIDSINAIVATGVAEWKTLKQAYTLWETAHNGQVFQLECGDITTGVNSLNASNSFSVFPNPMTTHAKIQNNSNQTMHFKLRNILGIEVFKNNIENIFQFERGNLPSGTYFYTLTGNDFTTTGKLIIQ